CGRDRLRRCPKRDINISININTRADIKINVIVEIDKPPYHCQRDNISVLQRAIDMGLLDDGHRPRVLPARRSQSSLVLRPTAQHGASVVTAPPSSYYYTAISTGSSATGTMYYSNSGSSASSVYVPSSTFAPSTTSGAASSTQTAAPVTPVTTTSRAATSSRSASTSGVQQFTGAASGRGMYGGDAAVFGAVVAALGFI
ncbi:hypothetical protein LTR28_013728, partial [Elasticomyces elasticus]